VSFLVKICGITTPDDAELAIDAGADAIGLNFWPKSSRFVDERKAAAIARVVPEGVLKVGVFVNAHPLVVAETAEELRLDRIQLHGNERVADFSDVETGRLIRTIRVRDEGSLKEALAWDVGMFIYEGDPPGYGGSGEVAPWPLIAQGARRPFLLAGGLRPENVAEAIAMVRPDGVDVSSGVEHDKGRKDPAAVRAFIANARRAAAELGSGR